MSQTKINTGYQDGVSVIADIENSRYILDAPNDYDVNYAFRGKMWTVPSSLKSCNLQTRKEQCLPFHWILQPTTRQ